jgi:integral membrane sensor domain MASE1
LLTDAAAAALFCSGLCAAAGATVGGRLRPALLLLLLLALLQQLPVSIHQGKEVIKLCIIQSQEALQHSTAQHTTPQLSTAPAHMDNMSGKDCVSALVHPAH